MKSDEFINFIKDYFENLYRDLIRSVNDGNAKIGPQVSFPSNIRFAQSPTHYAAEFLGYRKFSLKKFQFPNKQRLESYSNINHFINPGNLVFKEPFVSALQMDNAYDIMISDITFSNKQGVDTLTKKLNFEKSSVNITRANANVPFTISENSNLFLLRNVDLFLITDMQFFYKPINTMIIVRKDTQLQNFTYWLHEKVQSTLKSEHLNKDILGLNTREFHSGETISKQLFGLANQNIKESILDKFIADHSDHFAEVLGYEYAHPQIHLKIFNTEGKWSGQSLIPDYLLKRKDGYYDILDLKKGLLDFSSITKGKSSRIRFVSYASELLAQLAGYQKYFDNPYNKDWAKKEFGIEIKNPILIGIIGNHDNFNRDHVNEALYQYRDNVLIMSYLDLANLFARKNIIF